MAIELEPTRASQDDLRRLYLLAALVDEGAEARGSLSVKDAADSIKVMFPQAKSMAGKDIEALKEDGLVSPVDDSFATGPSNPQTYVLDQGVTVIEELRQLLEESLDDRAAVLAPLILRYMIKNSTKVPSTSTPTLRKVGFTLLGEPLPDGSVEETLDKLWQLKLITGPGGHGKRLVKPTGVTPEGYERFHGGDSILLPSRNSQVSSSVYNTTNNIGQVRSQNVVVGSQGQIQQTASLEISVTQAIEKLRMTTENLHAALADHPELQREVDERLDELDEAEKAGEKNRIFTVASKLHRRASRLAEKTAYAGVAGAASTAAQELIRLILPFAG